MRHAGWFHRDLHGSGQLQWIPADASGQAADASAAAGSGVHPDVAGPVPPGPFPVSEARDGGPPGSMNFLDALVHRRQR